jgi:hypothetical protein
VEYGTAQAPGAEAKGTMRDDCISGRESKVFELGSEKPQRGSRNEEVQCLCGMGVGVHFLLVLARAQGDRDFRLIILE